jgi:hypothetical protein
MILAEVQQELERIVADFEVVNVQARAAGSAVVGTLSVFA